MIRPMSPGLVLLLLVAGLLALLPVWRLRVAGWSASTLGVAWLLYAAGMIAAIRLPEVDRYLVPILVLAWLAPFVAGPERLARVARRRHVTATVIDVTPRLPGGGHDGDRAEPPRTVEGEVIEDTAHRRT